MRGLGQYRKPNLMRPQCIEKHDVVTSITVHVADRKVRAARSEGFIEENHFFDVESDISAPAAPATLGSKSICSAKS